MNMRYCLFIALLLPLLLGGCGCRDCDPYAAYNDCYYGNCAPRVQGCPQGTGHKQAQSLFYWQGSRENN